MPQSAVEELEAAAFPFRRQINHAIVKLKADPRPIRSEQIADTPIYRLTVGDWTVLYEIDDEREIVAILEIVGPRRSRPS